MDEFDYSYKFRVRKALDEYKRTGKLPDSDWVTSVLGGIWEAIIGIAFFFFFILAADSAAWLFHTLHQRKPQMVLVIALVGIAMYIVKRTKPIYYGIGAISFGVALAYRVVFYQWQTASGNEGERVASWLALGTSIYAIARGIDDFVKGRKEEAEKRKSNWG